LEKRNPALLSMKRSYKKWTNWSLRVPISEPVGAPPLLHIFLKQTLSLKSDVID